MQGHLVGSDEATTRARRRFTGFRAASSWSSTQIDFMCLTIESLELIGYDPEGDSFPSTVFSNLSPRPLPYRWDVRGDDVSISVRGARRHVHGVVARERLLGRLATEPRRRPEHQRALRHRRPPARPSRRRRLNLPPGTPG
jgi:hypothetical protein